MKRSSKIVRKVLASAMVLALLAGSGLATTGSAVIGGLTVSAATSDPTTDIKIVDSGKCGENITYTLDSEGTLTIEGEGDITNNSTYHDSTGMYGLFGKYYSIKKVIIRDGIKRIGSDTFAGCSSLTNISIPDSVTSIGSNAFYGCSSLTNITIPNSVTSIGSNAFYGCSSLTNISVDSNNPNYCFENDILFTKDKKTIIFCSTGKSGQYVIPDSVTSIGDEIFNNCKNLTNITIPNSVTSIGDYAFRGCSSLTNITIPNSVTSIGYGAFYKCTSLTSVTIPDSVTRVEGYAFYACKNLTNVTIPNSATSIGNYAFYSCKNLTNITIPNSVTSIGDYAFFGCKNLTNITIPNKVTEIASINTFAKCYNLTNITIPNSVTYIDDYAFEDCSNLIIYGKKDSYAEEFANDNDILFKTIKKNEVINISNTSAENIILGQKVTLNGDATGGVGDYQYAYYYKKTSDTKWATAKGYSTATSVTIKPARATTYDVCIKVKDSQGTVAKQYFKISVGKKLENTSTVSTDNIKLGEKIALKGTAVGGSGKYQYAYYYKKTSETKWTTAKNYSTATSVTIKPARATTYDICIKAKDSNGTIAKKYFKATVSK